MKVITLFYRDSHSVHTVDDDVDVEQWMKARWEPSLVKIEVVTYVMHSEDFGFTKVVNEPDRHERETPPSA